MQLRLQAEPAVGLICKQSCAKGVMGEDAKSKCTTCSWVLTNVIENLAHRSLHQGALRDDHQASTLLNGMT